MIWLLAVVEITAHSDCKTPKQRGGEAVEGEGEGGTHNCTVPHEGQTRLTLKQTAKLEKLHFWRTGYKPNYKYRIFWLKDPVVGTDGLCLYRITSFW